MSSDPKFPLDPAPKSTEERLAELMRENERLQRRVADTEMERDRFKRLYLEEAAANDPKLTADDIASAVPARPVIDDLIRQLERP